MMRTGNFIKALFTAVIFMAGYNNLCFGQVWGTTTVPTFTTGNLSVGVTAPSSLYTLHAIAKPASPNLLFEHPGGFISNNRLNFLNLNFNPNTTSRGLFIKPFFTGAGAGTHYGLYIDGNGTFQNSNKYGIYVKNLGKSNYAAFLDGELNVRNGDIKIQAGSSFNNTHIIHVGWQNDDYSLNFTPYSASNQPLFNNRLSLYRDGKLKKWFDPSNINNVAISVTNSSDLDY